MNENRTQRERKVKHEKHTLYNQKPELGTYLSCVETEKQTLNCASEHSERIFLIELPWLRAACTHTHTRRMNWTSTGMFLMTVCLLFLYWLKYLFPDLQNLSLTLSLYLSGSLCSPPLWLSPTRWLIRLLTRPLACSLIQSQSFRWQPANWTNLSLFILFISCIWKLIYCTHFGISVLT